MRRKAIWITVAVAIALLIGLAVMHQFTRATGTADGKADQALPKIKTGVIVSLFTATGPSWLGTPYGYGPATRIVKELSDPTIELVPIIEPGSDSDEALQQVLKKSFPGKTPVVAADAAHLKDVDVIVAAGVSNAMDEMLAAVEGRVKNGAGLLIRQSFGVVTPEYTPQVIALNGFTDAQYGLTRGGSGKVIAEHPLLGKLKVGRVIKMTPNGAYGKLATGGVGLIEVVDGDLSPIGAQARQRDDFVFYPLFISQLGKGKIVGCSFAHSQPVPAELNSAATGKFTVRCVKWLAGRALE